MVHTGGERVAPSCALVHREGEPVPPPCAMLHKGGESVPPHYAVVHMGGEPVPPPCFTLTPTSCKHARQNPALSVTQTTVHATQAYSNKLMYAES